MLMPSAFGKDFFDDFFDDFVRPVGHLTQVSPSANVLKTDIKETEDGFELDMEAPGFNKDDVTARLKDGYLIVSAKNEENKDEKDSDGKYIRRERSYGSYTRSFFVGDHLTEEDITARFENGILNIHVPKKKPLPKEEDKYIAIAG